MFCYCHFVIRQDRSRSAGLQKHLFHTRSSQGRSSVPSSVLPCVGNLINIRSTQKLSWIPLFYARVHRMLSLWATGTTRFESVDIICQIWPIKGYTRGWYTGMGRLRKWLQVPPPPLSPVSFRFLFVFALFQFSNPAKFTKTWKIPQNSVEILSNTSLYNIFETYLSYWGCLLAVNLQIYLETSSLKCANNVQKTNRCR